MYLESADGLGMAYQAGDAVAPTPAPIAKPSPTPLLSPVFSQSTTPTTVSHSDAADKPQRVRKLKVKLSQAKNLTPSLLIT